MQNIFWKRLCDTKVNEFFSHFQNMLVWLIRKRYAALQLGFLCWKYIDSPSSPTPFPHTPYVPIALTTEKLIPLSPIRSENYINKKHSNSPWKISCLRKCSFNGTKPMTVLVFIFCRCKSNNYTLKQKPVVIVAFYRKVVAGYICRYQNTQQVYKLYI